MTTRRTAFCQACASLVGVRVEWGTSIGPPEAPCPRCGSPLRTGQREWAEHSAPARALYAAKAVVDLAASLVVVGVGAMLAGMALSLTVLSSRAAAWVALCLIPTGAVGAAWCEASRRLGEVRRSKARTAAGAERRGAGARRAA